MDRDNLHPFVISEPVDNPVALNDNLMHVLPAQLWNNTTHPRERSKSIRRVKSSHSEQLCVSWGVPSDEQAHRLQIIQRLLRPGYASHLAIRLRASSWETLCPASAWAIPRSTL